MIVPRGHVPWHPCTVKDFAYSKPASPMFFRNKESITETMFCDRYLFISGNQEHLTNSLPIHLCDLKNPILNFLRDT